MKKLLILLLIIMNLTANDSCEDYNNSVDNYVIELLMQSSVKNRLKEAHYFIDTTDNGNKTIQVFLENKKREEFEMSSIETIGWFDFDMKNFKLYETLIADPDNPIEVKYKKGWRAIIATVSLEEARQCIKVKDKSWLYKKADINSQSKKFLIKDDVALILKRKEGWYKIYFYHSKFHTHAIFWIRAEDVEEE